MKTLVETIRRFFTRSQPWEPPDEVRIVEQWQKTLSKRMDSLELTLQLRQRQNDENAKAEGRTGGPD